MRVRPTGETGSRRRSWALVLLLLLGPALARAQDEHVNEVAALVGTAEVLHPGTTGWIALQRGSALRPGDQLRTSADSKLTFTLGDGTKQTLGPSATLVLDQLEELGGQSILKGLVGVLRSVIPTERFRTGGPRFQVRTETAVAGSRHTMFIVSYDPVAKRTLVVGLEGTTWVRSADNAPSSEVLLGPNMSTEVGAGEKPSPPRPIDAARLRALRDATELTTGDLKPEEEIPVPPKPSTGPPSGAEPEIPFREPPVPDQTIKPPAPPRPGRGD